MGVCLSCLGQGEEPVPPTDTEAAHLLGDASAQHGYGSTSSDPRSANYVDPEVLQRQRDNLERLCAQTSHSLIDVTPPPANPDLVKFLRETGPLFEECFFKGQPSKEENAEQWHAMGVVEMEVVMKVKKPIRDGTPMVHSFDDKWS